MKRVYTNAYSNNPASEAALNSGAPHSDRYSRPIGSSASAFASSASNAPRSVISRDEMNLSEFPLTVLSTRTNNSIKTLEFKDSIRGKNGEVVQRAWIITGADKFGLPTASDDEVLLGLLKLTVDHGFEERKIFFSRYELLKNLRWSTEGRSYQRLQKALDRLSGVRIKATNAFYDNDAKAHSTKNFGIIDAYEINDGRDEKPSFFTWSEVIFKSFQSGFIKKLDLDFYLNLKSATAKRLYRFLDKHFWYRSTVNYNLFVLAHEKIGISRTYQYASLLKQQLEPALDELKACDFIGEYSFTGRGEGSEISITAASRTPRINQVSGTNQNAGATNFEEQSAKQRVSTRTPEMERGPKVQNKIFEVVVEKEDIYSERLPVTSYSMVAEALMARGIKHSQLQALVGHFHEDDLKRCEQIVEYFDSLVAQNSSKVSKSPIGFLYTAIKNQKEFVLPFEVKAKAQAAVSASKVAYQKQQAFQFQQQKAKTAVAASKTNAEEAKRVSYLVARKRRADELKDEVEPKLLAKLRQEIEDAFSKLKGALSDEGFRRAVDQGIEEKLLKLFAFPNFDEFTGK